MIIGSVDKTAETQAQLFFCFMPFHDILKRNGGDFRWQDQKNIILC